MMLIKLVEWEKREFFQQKWLGKICRVGTNLNRSAKIDKLWCSPKERQVGMYSKEGGDKNYKTKIPGEL